MMEEGIVIAEKEGIVALDLERQVKRLGYHPLAVFFSGEELLKKLPGLEPSVIILATELRGGYSGLDTADLIKENFDIPVILLTNFVDELSREEKQRLMSFTYVVKPYAARELELALEMALTRHSMEKRLRRSEESYRSFFEDDLSANFIADAQGQVLTCNSAFARIFGYQEPKDAEGFNLADHFLAREDGERFFLEVGKKKSLVMAERIFQSRDGREVPIVGNFMGQFDSQGELTGIIGYLHDTSEQKQLEEMLRQSQKLEAIGRLTGGIAHDFNNVLTIIMGYTELIKEKIREGEDIKSDIDGIRSASAKAASLTRQLLTFSRRQKLNPLHIDINHLLQDLQKMINRLLGEDIIMRLYANAEEAVVFADPGMLEQVILNLAVNARDAMPGGGHLIIETKTLALEDGPVSVMGKIPPGHYVLITVNDTGTGIAPEVKEKIFEPFFTTKPEYQGTGLGLSSAYGIIKESEGYIRLESEINKGTSFFLYLPLRRNFLEENLSDKNEPEPLSHGDEILLVVEDESQIREILLKLLSQAGYQVLGAENAGEALLLCENNPDIRLVITDYMMPHLNGLKLIERLKSQMPHLKFILTSGFQEAFIEEREKLEPSIRYLMKPFDNARLLWIVREMLDE